MSHETENPGQEAEQVDIYPIAPVSGSGIEIYDETEAEKRFITVGGLAPLVDAVREIVNNAILQTDDDRIALAKRVRKTATEAEKYGKSLAAAYKARPKIIDGNRKHVADSLDDLHDSIMQPITERKARRERLDAIASLPAVRSMATIAELDTELQRLYDIAPSEFVELETEFAATRERVQSELLAIKAKREQEEADRAELERLRAEAAKREQEAAIERARAEGERIACERMAQEKVSTERTAIAAAQAKQETSSVITREIANEAAQNSRATDPRNMAYQDIKSIIQTADYGADLAKLIVEQIASGRVRGVAIRG